MLPTALQCTLRELILAGTNFGERRNFLKNLILAGTNFGESTKLLILAGTYFGESTKFLFLAGIYFGESAKFLILAGTYFGEAVKKIDKILSSVNDMMLTSTCQDQSSKMTFDFGKYIYYLKGTYFGGN